ncbi:hypothetical protein [Gordonia sp. HS-NH1]|uniref:hypothetical protein n=1 Tax=Gordonia sp. HS-NH1 TaxID=1435068 RepID=UPI000A905701|nr:hypothetical protein [Gordonia sp. HS-NH1]
MKSPRQATIRLAILGVAAAVIITLIVQAIQRPVSGETVDYRATFGDVFGLTQKADVRLRGEEERKEQVGQEVRGCAGHTSPAHRGLGGGRDRRRSRSRLRNPLDHRWFADELAAVNTKIATDAEAEKVAGDYALNVSKVDYQDIDAWRTALETGVTQQLKEKMSTAVDVVAPLLTQMQYVSTAEKLAATVASSNGNQYVVRVFVDMDSESRQTPDGVTATASYTITLDKASGWTITDVGGLGAGLPGQPGN